MAIWEIRQNALHRVDETTYREQELRERQDLQRSIRTNIAAVAPDTMVMSKEYGDWTEGRRRIDLLCRDRQVNFVVIDPSPWLADEYSASDSHSP